MPDSLDGLQNAHTNWIEVHPESQQHNNALWDAKHPIPEGQYVAEKEGTKR